MTLVESNGTITLHSAQHFTRADESNAVFFMLRENAIARSSYLCALPACMMLIGSFLVYIWQPKKLYVSAMQHLAAGIVLAAIAVELIPPITKRKNAASVAGVIIGFVIGVALMILMRFLFDEDDDEDEEDGDGEEADTMTDEKKPLNITINPASPSQMSFKDASEEDVLATKSDSKLAVSSLAVSSKHISKSSGSKRSNIYSGFFFSGPNYTEKYRTSIAELDAADDRKSLDLSRGNIAVPPFPVAFMFAVCVDGFTDGLLIGITSSTGGTTGWVIAASLCVEMFFLGLTFSSCVLKQPRKFSIPAILIPPLMIIVGGLTPK